MGEGPGRGAVTGRKGRSGRPRVPDERRERDARALREARAEAGLSLRQLGEILGCTKQAISAFEHARWPVPARIMDWVRAQEEGECG